MQDVEYALRKILARESFGHSCNFTGRRMEIANAIYIIDLMPTAYRPEYDVVEILGGNCYLVIRVDAPALICANYGHIFDYTPLTKTCSRCRIQQEYDPATEFYK